MLAHSILNAKPSFIADVDVMCLPEHALYSVVSNAPVAQLLEGDSKESKDNPGYEDVRVGNILAKSFWAWLIFSLKDT